MFFITTPSSEFNHIIKEYNKLTDPFHIYYNKNAIILGNFLKDKKNKQVKYILCMQDAKSGNSLGFNNVGFMLEICNKQDSAHSWYKKSADLNNSIGMYNLAKILLKTPSYDNEKKAMILLVKSINLGSILSMDYLLHIDIVDKHYKELLNIDFNKQNSLNCEILLRKTARSLRRVINTNISMEEKLNIFIIYSNIQNDYEKYNINPLNLNSKCIIYIINKYIDYMPVYIPIELNKLIIYFLL